VIVRAYEDEPRLLTARGGDAYVEVVNDVTGSSIAFPASQVFEYDQRLFEALERAYATKDRTALASLWSSARRYEH